MDLTVSIWIFERFEDGGGCPITLSFNPRAVGFPAVRKGCVLSVGLTMFPAVI